MPTPKPTRRNTKIRHFGSFRTRDAIFELTPIFIDNERRDPKKAWFTIGAVHLPDGFFMNWTGTQQGEGFEYHLLAIAIGLAVFIKGSGAMSVDRALTQHLRRPGEAKKERFAA